MCFRRSGHRGRIALMCICLAFYLDIDISWGKDDSAPAQETTPPENNTLCYTCHLGLEQEAITAQHIVKGITCMSCHGPSVEHMHDEMQVTKPDRIFGRGEVDAQCLTCHEVHKDTDKVATFRKQWLGKTRPNGRVITETSICTDCHGTHNYIQAHAQHATESAWAPLFSGGDLKAWEIPGESCWSLRARRLTALPSANDKRTRLVTKGEYADFQLSITFRADWPVNAWVCLRCGQDTSVPRVALGNLPNPRAHPGSIWLPDKGIALANLEEKRVDRLTWNTLLIEARQDRYATWLNGEEIGSVRINGPTKGRIAMDCAGHPENKQSRLQISEIHLRRLDGPAKEAGKQGRGDAL